VRIGAKSTCLGRGPGARFIGVGEILLFSPGGRVPGPSSKSWQLSAQTFIETLVLPTPKGSFRLFRLFSVQVFIHWSWFVVAVYEVQNRAHQYSSLGWNVAEYLGLFLIVLLHEFGHSLACRSTGGQADQIVLWPLGGVAYVNPPQRPGAMLWSIAAGPLVNVVLVPVLLVLALVLGRLGITGDSDLYQLARNLSIINVAILIFNLLPIYPLDGGQILRSLLWFWLGRGRSLMVASIIGLVGVAAVIAMAVFSGSLWLIIMSIFIMLNCWRALRLAKAMSRIAELPRREGYRCPACHTPPVTGPYWKCAACGTNFDTFATGATCPNCRQIFPTTQCIDCGAAHPFEQWRIEVTPPPLVSKSGP
jgi:Zn-dependent protease